MKQSFILNRKCLLNKRNMANLSAVSINQIIYNPNNKNNKSSSSSSTVLFIFTISGLLLFLVHISQSQVTAQDIIFPDQKHKHGVMVHGTLHYSTTTTTIKPPTSHNNNNSSGGKNCETLCIVLDLCPSLSQLLLNPTKNNLLILKYASCGFTSGGDDGDPFPLVWCDEFICDPFKRLLLKNLNSSYTSSSSSSIRNNNDNNESRLNFPNQKDFNNKNENQAIFSNPPSSFITTRSALASPKISDSKSHHNLVSSLPQQEQDKQASSTSVKFEDHDSSKSDPGASDINSEDCGIAFPSRINGGNSASKGEFPWIVAISVNTKLGQKVICGGALISNSWVITAAHCVTDSAHNQRNISHVRVGAHNISNINEDGAENISIRRVIYHEQFRERPVVKNDIALLQLEKPINLSTIVGSICLPNASIPLSSLYEVDKLTTIAGWGSDGIKSNYSILQKVQIPLVDGDICKKIFYRIRVRVVTDVQVCAGEQNKDSCKGDSGGPLMIEIDGRTTLIGIISYGTTQCDGRLPGVYTKITSYMDWIQTNIAKYS